MDVGDMKQTCLALQQASGKLHDILDLSGITGPIDSLENILVIKDIVDNAQVIQSYFQWEHVLRMLKMGVDPADLTRLMKE